MKKIIENVKPDFSDNSILFFIPRLHKSNKLLYSYKQLGYIECGSKYWNERFGNFDAYFIFVVTDGIGKLTYKNQEKTIRKGQMIFINQDYHYILKNDSTELLCGYYIYGNGPIFPEMYLEIERKYSNYILDKIDLTKFKVLFDNIISILSKETHSDYEISEYIYKILMHIHENSLPNETQFDENVKNAISFIQKYYDKRLSLDEICSNTYLSKFYFSRLFKKQTGFSPLNYVNEVRFEKSKRLLIITNLTINQIAEEVGYSYKKAMVLAFKKRMNILPSKYRKMHRN